MIYKNGNVAIPIAQFLAAGITKVFNHNTSIIQQADENRSRETKEI